MPGTFIIELWDNALYKVLVKKASSDMKISVVIPVYNEEKTLEQIVDRVGSVDIGLPKEIILVDDGSTDGTAAVMDDLAGRVEGLVIIRQERNKGKGAALRAGFARAGGDFILVQDADLEYDPSDYAALLEPLMNGHADVVYGSRFIGGGPHRVFHYWHYLGNRMLTTFSNMMTNLNLTDMEVCYKVFRAEVLRNMRLRENRFGFEVEITAKVARRKYRIYEVPVGYYGRTYADGKKITWRDGLQALWCIIKYRFID